MPGIDSATWQALGLLLTLLGLGASAVLWTRRGAISGLRGVAWSLLPLAAGLTGVLRLGWEITDSVVSWAARLVFSPVVWLGIVVAAVSLVLFVVTGMARRREGRRSLPGGSAQSRGQTGASSPGTSVASGTDRAPAGSVGSGVRPGASAKSGSSGKDTPAPSASAGMKDDMAEIEEILRRRGIT